MTKKIQFIEDLKSTIYSLDLAIVEGKTQLDFQRNRMNLYKNFYKHKSNKNKYAREIELYSNARAYEQLLMAYIDNLAKAKNRAVDSLLCVVGAQYQSKQVQEIWKLYFIEEKNIAEITKLVKGYSRSSVTRIIQKMIDDIAWYEDNEAKMKNVNEVALSSNVYGNEGKKSKDDEDDID